MGVYLADQTVAFLHACLLGAALGACYDVFRILRIALPTGKRIVFVQDVLFWAVAAVVTFLFLLTELDGVVRVFLLIGEFLGAVIYYFTLGQLVMAISKTIIAVVRAILLFVFRWLLLPVWKLFYAIVSLILRPLFFLGGLGKKSLQRCKFRLKVRRIVLYNAFIGYLEKGMRGRTKRERGKHGEEKAETPQE